MKILNPAYVEPVSPKETKIRNVISAKVTAMAPGGRALSFAEIAAEVRVQFPTLNFGAGDVHAAALALGLVVAGD